MWDKLKQYIEKIHPCIVCGGIDFTDWATERYLVAKKCTDCGMISVNPHFSDEGLEIFYSEYFQKRKENQLLREQREETYLIDRDWVCNFVGGGRVLDVGCSGGFFLSKFPSDVWEREGAEIASDSAEYARKHFGINIYEGLLTEIDFPHQYDLVMFRGVIEHFRDPISVLNKCEQIIKPGGHIFITATPAGDSFAFDVYREKWRLFVPLEHIHFFTVKLLTRVLNKVGFKHVTHHYQYQETPYADPENDYKKIRQAIVLKHKDRFDKIIESVPFPGSMVTAIWKKTVKS